MANSYGDTSKAGWYTYSKITKAAEALRKRKPHLTKEQAVDEVCKQRPDLASAYSDEARRDIAGKW
jgi:hypothetical protein